LQAQLINDYRLESFFVFNVQGVFVMNTEEEISQAEKDYRLGQNGFEGAKEWNSFVVYEDDDPSTLIPQ
jgi:hypothetical protein